MVNANTMAELEKLGFGADIDALETYIATLQDAAGLGTPLVDDAAYDAHVRILKQLKPTSSVLNRNWEVEDNELTEYDSMLTQYGMCSITTITSHEEANRFRNALYEIGHPVDCLASIKLNGHGVRAVYLNGQLYTGSTRGRYKKGRDITKHLNAVLPHYVEAWKNTQIVEVRGEMLVKISVFEKYLKNIRKTPLSSVTSLIRDSVTDEELKHLTMVCYKVLSSNDDLKFNSLVEELMHLKNNGFEIPPITGYKDVTGDNLNDAIDGAINHFENMLESGGIDYSCDGIVLAINDNATFYSSGKNGNSWNGNIAIKMGQHWESNIYSAEILDIQFIPGKSYMTPKAIVEPVTTATGAQVTTVPLYNIGVMERYHYVKGETIYFRFGGETGVTTCDVYGNSVSVNG